MNCPPDLTDLLLTILRIGLLRTRAASHTGNVDRAGVEADHIHNLPELLRDYSDERLRFYWQVERPAFLTRSGAANTIDFDPAWDGLRACLERDPDAVSA